MTGARIVAVVGPSGVGKDSLIRALVAADIAMVWMRRVVTRPADPTEPFVPVDGTTFDAMEAKQAFALSWRAHGLRYGIPQAEVAALGPGQTGLVNLSRGVLGDAAKVLPRLSVLSVTAPAEVLARRLSDRGRESAGAVAARLDRPAPAFSEVLPMFVVDNGGTLEDAVASARNWLGQAPE